MRRVQQAQLAWSAQPVSLALTDQWVCLALQALTVPMAKSAQLAWPVQLVRQVPPELLAQKVQRVRLVLRVPLGRLARLD
ncbi:MAG: hypothetical protein Q8S32_10840 [Burkholderiaceae bacterium]|nr:hypothetical protein [Burkholderiaceae bacterium]